MKNAELLGKHWIYLITEGKSTPQNFSTAKVGILKIIKLAIYAKIDLIQIREKKIAARHLFELASEAAIISANTSTKILINDRADIALAAKADGVHLSSKSISTNQIRTSFPKDFVIGVSTHTIEEARNARKGGANFVTFSPIFETESKEKFGAPQGLEKLRKVCELLKTFPVIALGGINGKNIPQVIEAGAHGFAAIRYLNDEQNLRKL